GGAALGNLRAHRRGVRTSGPLLRSQFSRIELGDQIALLDLGAFIYRELLDAPSDLGADHNFVGVNRSDEYQVAGAIGREKVVDDGDQRDHRQQHDELFALGHWLLLSSRVSPLDLVNKAAEMKSRTALRRAATSSGERGSRPVITAMTGALP